MQEKAKLVETSRKQYVQCVYLVIYTKSTSTINRGVSHAITTYEGNFYTPQILWDKTI
jgi:hypothetical protein